MTEEELATIEAAHQMTVGHCYAIYSATEGCGTHSKISYLCEWCTTDDCDVRWPCHAVQLAAEVRRLQGLIHGFIHRECACHGGRIDIFCYRESGCWEPALPEDEDQP